MPKAAPVLHPACQPMSDVFFTTGMLTDSLNDSRRWREGGGNHVACIKTTTVKWGRGGKCAPRRVTEPLRSARTEQLHGGTEPRAPGSTRLASDTHLIAKSSSRTRGKSGESRSNTGQSLVSLLCLASISFTFTCPAAYPLGKKGRIVCV